MMMINGVAISSIPDLRLTVSASPSLSLFVIKIVKVSFTIFVTEVVTC